MEILDEDAKHEIILGKILIFAHDSRGVLTCYGWV